MPSILAHYAMSLVVLYRVAGAWRAAVLAMLGLLPDVDALLEVHRSPLHSLLVWLPALLLALGARGRRWAGPVLAASLLSMLHIAADVFTGPTPLLWPLLPQAYSVDVDVTVVLSGSSSPVAGIEQLTVDLRVEETAAEFRAGPIAGPLVDTSGVVASLTAAALAVADYAEKRTRQRSTGRS